MDVGRLLGEGDAVLPPALVEEADLHPVGDLGEDREVRPDAVVGGAEWIGPPGSDLHRDARASASGYRADGGALHEAAPAEAGRRVSGVTLLDRASAADPASGPADSELLASGPSELAAVAAARRDAIFGTRVTFSPKVFIPLTMLCRDRCGYCTFAKPPARLESPYLAP